MGLFLLGVAVVLRFVCFGFGPAMAGIWRALISYPVEHLGEFEYPSILFKVHPFPQSLRIQQILFLFFLHPSDPFLHLPFITILQHLLLLYLLPQLPIILNHEIVDGLLIVSMRMLHEGFAFYLLEELLLLDLLLVVLQDVAEVALLHEVDFSLLLGGVPE